MRMKKSSIRGFQEALLSQPEFRGKALSSNF